MHECRIIVDPPRDGTWNMAVDEVLLDRAAVEHRPQVRLYAWHTETLSLGYFQRVADRASHQSSSGCPLVRRCSGGGAIIHDREITYSLALPGRSQLNAAVLYRRVHSALVDMLARIGIAAALAESPDGDGAAAPWLCFQRRAVGDVLIDGHKVVGSAQRRARGAVLQHGSILLAASPAAPELPGINDLTPTVLSSLTWQGEVRRALVLALEGSASEEPLTDEELMAARELVESKYRRSGWNERR
jgi:lipoate-protein ligase A